MVTPEPCNHNTQCTRPDALSESEVKRQMMQLWKDTFHDSDEYISLIFDSYFNPELVEYEVVDGRIVSALLAIPYSFNACSGKYANVNRASSKSNIGENESADIVDLASDNLLIHESNINPSMRGLYLCGLATDEKFRAKGIMSKLIERINVKAAKLGFAFTFLIPASESLSLYYSNKMYSNCCYKSNLNYVKNYRFDKDNSDYGLIGNDGIIQYNVSEHKGEVDKYNLVFIASERDIHVWSKLLYDYFNCCFNNSKSVFINKTVFDISVILYENIVSSGYCIIALNSSKSISGVLLAQRKDEDVVRVQQILSDNSDVRNIMLQYLQNKIGQNYSIEVEEYKCDGESKIFSPYRETFSPQFSEGVIAPHEEVVTPEMLQKPYAMARITQLAEVLIFAAALYPGRKYSILISDAVSPENTGFFEVEKGRVSHIPLAHLSKDDLKRIERETACTPSVYHLKMQELQSLLWRHASDSLLDDVIDIPRLPLNISLMLE